MLIVLLLQWQDKWKLFMPPYISSIINATWSFKNMCFLCLDYMGILNTINYSPGGQGSVGWSGIPYTKRWWFKSQSGHRPRGLSAALSPLLLCLSNFRCLSASWEYHPPTHGARWAPPGCSLPPLYAGCRKEAEFIMGLTSFVSCLCGITFFFNRLIFSMLDWEAGTCPSAPSPDKVQYCSSWQGGNI